LGPTGPTRCRFFTIIGRGLSICFQAFKATWQAGVDSGVAFSWHVTLDGVVLLALELSAD
jgi:hypothetical protein